MVPKWFFDAVTNYRADRIARYLSHHMTAGESVLDCGCGSMVVAERLRRSHGMRAFGADVIQLERMNGRFCLCSGERLAFKNGSFDNVCLIFALHHISNITAALRECLRVTRKRLIVLEDVYRNSFELRLLKFLDYHGNRVISENMSFPYNFKTETWWRGTFENLDTGTRLIAVENIRPNQWRPSRHRMFILEKSSK